MKSSPQPRRSRRPQRTVSIIGTGSYVPERILTNRDLEQLVETSDEWIRTRTGISERRIAAPDEATSDMAAKAAIANPGPNALGGGFMGGCSQGKTRDAQYAQAVPPS